MKYKFVVMCATAMSSGLVAQKIQSEALTRGIDLDIDCISNFQYRQADFSGTDLILLAPQIRGQQSEINQYITENGWNSRIMAIDMQDYGLIRGKIILDKALSVLAGEAS